jgi:hypothetical protein
MIKSLFGIKSSYSNRFVLTIIHLKTDKHTVTIPLLHKKKKTQCGQVRKKERQTA